MFQTTHFLFQDWRINTNAIAQLGSYGCQVLGWASLEFKTGLIGQDVYFFPNPSLPHLSPPPSNTYTLKLEFIGVRICRLGLFLQPSSPSIANHSLFSSSKEVGHRQGKAVDEGVRHGHFTRDILWSQLLIDKLQILCSYVEISKYNP